MDAIPVADHVARRLIPGNASVIWCATRSAVGFTETLAYGVAAFEALRAAGVESHLVISKC